MDKKIVLLSRISTSAQNLESQTKDLINEAIRLGYSTDNQIIIESVESAIKLSEAERIGIQQLKEAIESDPTIDAVICWEPSRLSRQQKMLYSIRDYLVERKIQLIILNPYVKLLSDDRTKIDTTASIVFSLFATISENEMFLKKERFMRAKNELTRQGKKNAGAVILGYMKDENKYCIPHPIYSKMIVDLFNYYNTDPNSSLVEAYKYGSARWPEIFPLGEYKHMQHRMRHILDNKIYATGNWCYKPIISIELYESCKKKMAAAQAHPRYASRIQILGRGKVYCKQCGRMMTGIGGKTKAYNCSTDKLHSMCINVQMLDNIIWEETRVLANINASISNTTKISETTKQIEQKHVLVESYKIQLGQIEEKSDRLLDLYINGKLKREKYDARSADLASEKAKVENNITTLENQISSLESVLDSSQKDLLNYKTLNYDSINDFETRQELVRKYIDKVWISKVEPRVYMIEFTYPTGIYIVQSGLYKYMPKNQTKQLYRINADGTTDKIL